MDGIRMETSRRNWRVFLVNIITYFCYFLDPMERKEVTKQEIGERKDREYIRKD
jgi:hypothetical protein